MSRRMRLAVTLLTLLSLAILAPPALAAPKAVKPILSGTVYGSDGARIPAATVNVYTANKNGVYTQMSSLLTDANGWWTYTGKAGDYRIDFAASSSDPQSRNLTIADGATYTLDVTLQSYGSLVGTVSDGSTGAPLAGAVVELYRRNPDMSWPPDPEATVLTAADGTYDSGQILAGRYAVKASATGYVSSYYGGATLPTAIPVLVATGTTVTGINVALTAADANGTIDGQVVSGADQTPLRGVFVFIYKQNADGTWPPTSPGWGSPYRTVFTDSLGDYTSGPLPLGNYMVRFFTTHTGSQWWEYVATVDLATVVSLTYAGETLSGIDGWFGAP